ncbi:MAG: glycosyltransferase family 2 protein [Ruminococcaceae bacterium]|nr:glycosyltransferase family 2 protein [Oscillospiraceae bacterium]
MKFSILVPVYNVEQYIEQCVESLLNQTCKGEYEIILVDDGSTDSSGKICDKYAKEYPEKIKVIHKKNEGLVSARQAGIDAAKGEYSLFVDSDDFAEKNLLETVETVLNKNLHTDMVIYSFRYFADGKKTDRKNEFHQTKKIFTAENKNEIYEALMHTTFVTALWIKAVRTDILKKDPTDYSLYYDKSMAEDWFRSIPLLTYSDKIVYINKPLYCYRTNEESISRSFRPETIEKKNTLYVYKRFREYLPLWSIDDAEHIKKLDARWLNEVIYTFKQYYEHARSAEERKAVVDFDWASMLPDGVKNQKDNPFESKANRRIYNLITSKKYNHLRLMFLYRKFFKKMREIKKSFI